MFIFIIRCIVQAAQHLEDSSRRQSLRRSRSFKGVDVNTNRKSVFHLILVNTTNLYPLGMMPLLQTRIFGLHSCHKHLQPL